MGCPAEIVYSIYTYVDYIALIKIIRIHSCTFALAIYVILAICEEYRNKAQFLEDSIIMSLLK